MGFPGSDSRESACNAGDVGSILGPGRSPGEGNGYPLQYSCLENSIDGGAWQATVHGVTKLDMTERLTLSLSIRNWVMITSWTNFSKAMHKILWWNTDKIYETYPSEVNLSYKVHFHWVESPWSSLGIPESQKMLNRCYGGI